MEPTTTEFMKTLGVDAGLITLICFLVDRVKELLKMTDDKKYSKYYPVMSLLLALACGLAFYWGNWDMVIKTVLGYWVGATGLYKLYIMYLKATTPVIGNTPAPAPKV